MGRLFNALWAVLLVGVLGLLALSIVAPGVFQSLGLELPLVGAATLPSIDAAPSVAPAAAATPAIRLPQIAADTDTSQAQACSAAAPRFEHGLADLKTALGDRMGQPIECERVVDAAGDSEQRTTTGLAYYRAATNVAVFTDGQDHFALLPSGLVHWSGPEVDPPASAEPLQGVP